MIGGLHLYFFSGDLQIAAAIILLPKHEPDLKIMWSQHCKPVFNWLYFLESVYT